MNRTVLVTGSSGFLGRWLVRDLHALGYRVLGLDISPCHTNEPFLSSFFLHDLGQPLVTKLPPLGACIHLASGAGGFIKNAHLNSLVDYELTLLQNVRAICDQHRGARMIYTSSINVFEITGIPHENPLGSIDVKTPYARAKVLGEAYVEKYFPQFTILRSTNYFGADQTRTSPIMGESHVIPELLHKIYTQNVLEVLGHGEQIRNFLHVSDLSCLIFLILGHGSNLEFTHANVRSELFITIGQLARELMDHVGIKKPLRFDQHYTRYETAPITAFTCEHARTLGWSPKIDSIYEGLRLRCTAINTIPTNMSDPQRSAL